MKLVVDASVTVKWLLMNAPAEQNVLEAMQILGQILSGQHEILQPPHWLSEVLAVIARRAPSVAADSPRDLNALKAEIVCTDAAYLRAAELSHRLKHHLFDTLYHAVALEKGATLVTADERYFGVAMQEGAIQRLSNFSSSQTPSK